MAMWTGGKTSLCCQPGRVLLVVDYAVTCIALPPSCWLWPVTAQRACDPSPAGSPRLLALASGTLALRPGYRTMIDIRKSGKVVAIPLARRRNAIEPVTDERGDRPVLLAPDGCRLNRHGAGPIIRRVARCTQIATKVTPAACSDRPHWHLQYVRRGQSAG
jgi:hypothetical protein